MSSKYSYTEMLTSIKRVHNSLAVEVLSAENYDNYRSESMPSSSTIEKHLKDKIGTWTEIRDFAINWYNPSVRLNLSLLRMKVLKAVRACK